MNLAFKIVQQLVFTLTSVMAIVNQPNQDMVSDDDVYRWYTIVSKQKHCECELAIEIPTTGANCPLTKLIACPHDNQSIFQQWRWDGHMLKSRLNGLVWDLDNNKPRNVVLAHPTNSSDQQFQYNRRTKHIYPNVRRFRHIKVIDIAGGKLHYLQAEVIIYNVKSKYSPNQNFEFRSVN